MAEGGEMPPTTAASSASSVLTPRGYIQHCINTYPKGPNGNHFWKGVLDDGVLENFHEAAYSFFKKAYPRADEDTLTHFADIASIVGPDRALEAYDNYDSLWSDYTIPGRYRVPKVLYGIVGQLNADLEDLRNYYYEFISRRSDPRGVRVRGEVNPHFDETFAYISHGEEPEEVTENVRYPLPPLHPEFETDVTPVMRRKAIQDRRSSGFFEMTTAAESQYRRRQQEMFPEDDEEGGLEPEEDDDNNDDSDEREGGTGEDQNPQGLDGRYFKPVVEEDLLGFLNEETIHPQQPQQQQGQQQQGIAPETRIPSEARTQHRPSSANLGAKPKNTSSRATTPPASGGQQRPWSKDDIERQSAMLDYYKQEHEKKKKDQAKFQQQNQQAQQQASSSPYLRPQPQVPQPGAPPRVNQPQSIRPLANPSVSPVLYPAPAIRPSSHVMPLPLPYPRFQANTPIHNQTTRPFSRQSQASQASSRPSSVAENPTKQHLFFRREPSPPKDETFDEEIRRTEYDFPDNQRWAPNIITPEEQKQIDTLKHLKAQTEQALAEIYKHKTSLGSAPQGPNQQPYCGPDGDCNEWLGSSSQQQQQQWQGARTQYHSSQQTGSGSNYQQNFNQGGRVHFNESVNERDFMKEQREREASMGFNRSRGSEGFQQYQPNPTNFTPVLEGVGHVLDNYGESQQKIRMKKKTGIDHVLEALIKSGMSEDGIIAYLAAQNAQKENKRDHRNEYEIQTMQATQNTHPDFFDYNIRGQFPADILGPRFGRTYFSSELERQVAMKSIFQRVVDDPSCHENTKTIALRILGQFDGPRQLREEIALSTIQTMDALSTTLAGGAKSDATKISPPILGTRSDATIGTMKELYFQLGMDKGVKYKPGQGKPLHHYLHALGQKITALRLNSDSAYSMLLSLLEGDLQDDVRNLMIDGNPFEKTWIYLQNLVITPVAKDTLEKELHAIFKDNKNLLVHILGRIQSIISDFHSGIKNKEDREVLIRATTTENFKNYVSTHYGQSALSTVELIFENEKAKWKQECKIRASQGRPVTEKFYDIQKLKEIICSNLGNTSRGARGPSLLNIHALEAQVANLSLEHHPQSATTSLDAMVSQPSIHQNNNNNQGQGYPQQSFNSNRSRGRGRSFGNGGNRRGYNNQQENQDFSNPNHMPLGQQQPKPQQHHPSAPIQAQNTQQLSGYAPIDFDRLSKPIMRDSGNYVTTPMKIPAECYNSIERGYCFNCAVRGHFVYECPLYPGQTPITDRCSCQGFHAGECRAEYRSQMYEVKENGWEPPPAPAIKPDASSNNQGGYVNNGGGYRGNNNYRGGYQNYQGNPNRGGFNNRGSRRGNNNRYGRGLGYGGGFRPTPNNNQVDYSAPIPPANQQQNTATRAGNVIGNEGTQTVPTAAFMNTANVSQN